MPAKVSLIPDRILIGGVYNVRHETQYEALGYETDLDPLARQHMVLVIGDIPERPGYWRVMTVRIASILHTP
jgi:hypothetical protein